MKPIAAMCSAASLALLLVLGAAIEAGADSPKLKLGFQIRGGKFTIDPLKDREVCEYRRLPNRKPLDVSGFEILMPAGGHHFALWAYSGDLQDDGLFPHGPVDANACTGVSPDGATPHLLLANQSQRGLFMLPEGVALRIEPGEQVFLNSHMLNDGDQPLRPVVRAKFYRAKKGTIRAYANGMVIGNMTDIHIPAGGEQTLTAEWPAPVPIVIFQLATHQHRFGTYANVEIVSPDGSTRTLVYENEDWRHARSYKPEPPIRLAKGQKIRFTCRWRNTTDRDVRWGPTAFDEMCNILGFYYRDEDVDEPVNSPYCLPSRRGFFCPLSPKVTD